MKYFNPPSLIFYVLSLVDFFFIGMTVSALLGVADGQGLAGGAIILGSGMIAAILALVIAIWSAGRMATTQVARVNRILGVILLVFAIVFTWRYHIQKRNNQDYSEPVRPTTETLGQLEWPSMNQKIT